MSGNPHTSPHNPDDKTIHRWTRALAMRANHDSYSTIAKALDYKDHTGARYAVLAALEWTIQEPADELRRMEGMRLDQMTRSVGLTKEDMETAQDPETGELDFEKEKARLGRLIPKIHTLLRIQERRARLWGLDAPTIQKITTYVSDVPEDIVSERILRDPEYREQYFKVLELASARPPQPSGDGNGSGGGELGDGPTPSPPVDEAGGDSGGQLQASDGDDATGPREVDPG